MSAGKAVVILSGGIDSSTLLYKILDEGFDARVLSFIYGQRHVREIEAAKAVCAALGVEHRVIDISAVNQLLTGSALTDGLVDVPELPETAEHFDSLKITIVPNRNAIFLALAIGYAVSIGSDNVFFGAHFSDRGVYPDCREEFVTAFEASERLATDNPRLNVRAPFVDNDKSDIVRLGASLGVPFELTWTCYKGGEHHCGVCSSCRERKRAFVEAGVPDPTLYSNED